MTIRPVTVHGRPRWQLTYRQGGRTIRRTFPTEADAKTAWNDTRRDARDLGTLATIPQLDRLQLVECWQRARERGYSIAEACAAWESRGETRVGNIRLADLVVKCIAAKKERNLRPESLRILRSTLESFIDGQEDLPAHAITQEHVAAFLTGQGWSPRRRLGALIDLNTLFNWAVRARLLANNPAKAVERPILDDTVPQIFTVDECETLMALVQGPRFGALLPGVAIMLFAGVRPAEASRLTWAHVKADHVEITPDIAKGRSRRLIPSCDALRSFLALSRARRGGIMQASRLLETQLHAAMKRWPHDVLRHSWISYEVARSQNVDATALAAGNSAEVIFAKYRRVVTPDQAKLFFGIRPLI